MTTNGEIFSDGLVAALGGVSTVLGGVAARPEVHHILSGDPTDVTALVFSAVAVGAGLVGLVGGGINLVYGINDLRP